MQQDRGNGYEQTHSCVPFALIKNDHMNYEGVIVERT